MQNIKDIISTNIAVQQKLLGDDKLIKTISDVVATIINAYRIGKKILAAGNGGSAADAQHFIAEYVGRFYYDRPALAGIALSTDTSILTAIGNDYGYEDVFARQLQANGNEGDVFVGFSTSGNSANIVKALEVCKDKRIISVGFTGAKPAKMDALCNYIIKAPSTDTPRIQECHELIEHTICQLVEEAIFPK
ncbi:D-sedoheptulose 7-phosphate isomerase [Deferribacterales bacterium RsTz2092]|nr:phosphoheptose isomerase 2 [Deferribacterales bacterium]